MKNHQPLSPLQRAFKAFALLFTLLFAQAAVAATALDVPSGDYSLDKGHGYITFTYSHLGFSNPHVGFTNFEVDLDLDAKNPAASKLVVVIQTASISSRVALFDEHLRSADYFDAANHPTIEFRSTRIEMTSDTTANVHGDLTIRGVSKPVVLATILNKAGNHPIGRVPTLGLSATTNLKRTAWGIDKYAPLVGDEVGIEIEVELPQAQPAEK